MRPESKTRRGVVLLGLPVALLAGLGFFSQRSPSVTKYMVGTWKVITADNTSLTTFKSNGEFVEVITFISTGALSNADGSGVGTPLVFKGRYAAWRDTFRTFDRKRYLRSGGKDVLFVPSGSTLNDMIHYEAVAADKEFSKPKYFSKILSADWKRGVMTVRSPDFGASPGTTHTWTRQSD